MEGFGCQSCDCATTHDLTADYGGRVTCEPGTNTILSDEDLDGNADESWEFNECWYDDCSEEDDDDDDDGDDDGDDGDLMSEVRVWDVSIISEWDQLKREIVALYLSWKDKGLASNTEKNKGLALNRVMGWRWYTPWLVDLKTRADDVGFVIDDAEYARLNALLVNMANRGGGGVGGGGGGKKQRSLAIHLRL